MSALFRSFVVWLMLLALPLQGYAAASMMLCAPALPAQAAVMGQPGHDHAAMLAAMQKPAGGNQRDVSASAAAQPDGGAQHGMHDGRAAKAGHGGIKCGGAAACCVGAALAPDCALALPALALPTSAIFFYTGNITAVDLAHPERPPQAARI